MIIPRVSLSFFAMIAILAWLDWTLCLSFMVAATVHECGHFLVMRICHVPVHDVDVGADGIKIRSEMLNNKREIYCAAAGPLTGLLLSVFVMRIFPKLAVVSVLLSVVNIIPLYPLDGGRILRAILCIYLEEIRVRRVMNIVRWIVCSVLMLLACWGTVVIQAGLWPIGAALILLCRAGNRE